MMARKARVAPESSQSEENRSAKSSLLAFENPDLSSAITGKVIETNDKTNENLGLSDPKNSSKSRSSGKPHKRIARSVSEVVEEKEKQERNVFTRFDEEESGGEEEEATTEATKPAAKEKATGKKSGGDSGGHHHHSGGGSGATHPEGNIGANDGKCECCDGEGIICGVRLKWCGSEECDPDHLYYCDKNNKKAYEYEQCKHTCLTGKDRDYPDYCSILIDNHFFFPRKEKFEQMKKDLENQIENLNKTARQNFEKFQHSFDISPEERAEIAKKQEQEEKEAAEKAKAMAKAKTTTPSSKPVETTVPENEPESED